MKNQNKEKIESYKSYVESIDAVIFTSNGMITASFSKENTINIWNSKTGKTLKFQYDLAFQGRVWSSSSLKFSQNGRILILRENASGMVKLFNVKTGEEISRLEAKDEHGYAENYFNTALSPDGKLIASVDIEGYAKLWSVKNGELVKSFNGHDIGLDVAFSSDGKMLAAGFIDEKIRVWNIKTEQEILTIDHKITDYLCTNEAGIRTIKIAFSPSGKIIASSGTDNAIKLWNTDIGLHLKTFIGHTNHINSIVFSPDEKTFASLSEDETIRLWDIETESEITTLNERADSLKSIAFSPNNKFLASISTDSTLKLWDLDNTKNPVLTMNFLDNGTWLMTTPEGYFDTDAKAAQFGDTPWIIFKDLANMELPDFKKYYHEAVLLKKILTGEEFISSAESFENENTRPAIQIIEINPAGYGGITVKETAEANTFENKEAVNPFEDNRMISDEEYEKYISPFANKPAVTLEITVEPQNLNASVSVNIRTPQNAIHESSIIPLDYTIRMVIDALIDSFELPRFDDNCRLINYCLHSALQSRDLDDNETVRSARINEGDLLDLTISERQPDFVEITIEAPAPIDVTVDIRTPQNEIYAGSVLPLDHNFRMVIDELINHIELPRLDENAKPLNYSLYSSSQSRFLFDFETVQSAQIRHGDLLELIVSGYQPEVVEKTLEPINSDGLVTVDVRTPQNEIWEGAGLPLDYNFRRVIDELIDSFELPRLDEKMRQINYCFRSSLQNRYLFDLETVQSAQIRNGDLLEIMILEYSPSFTEEEHKVSVTEKFQREELPKIQKMIAESACDDCKLDFREQKWREFSPFQKIKPFFRNDLMLNLRKYTRNDFNNNEDFWCETQHFGYIVQGEAEVDFGVKKVIFRRGDGIFIPAGKKHKMRLLSKKMVVFYIDE